MYSVSPAVVTLFSSLHSISLYHPPNVYPVLEGVYSTLLSFHTAYTFTVSPFVILKFLTGALSLYTTFPFATFDHPLNVYFAVSLCSSDPS